MEIETFTPRITTDISDVPKLIECNLDELAPFIAERCAFAKSLVVDADSLADCDNAKKQAASIGKIEKAIARKRLEWTRAWSAPLDAIVEKCKRYESDLRDAAALLRTNAAQGEARIKGLKRDRLRGLWSERIGKFGLDGALRHFADFFALNTSEATVGNWLNKGMTDAKIQAAMDAELERCRHEAEAVAGLFADSPVEERTIANDALRRHFSSTEAAEAVTRWREQQKRLEEERQAEAERRRAEEETVSATPTPQPAPARTPSAPVPPKPSAEPVESFRFVLTGRRSDLTKMRLYGESLGITFKWIKD